MSSISAVSSSSSSDVSLVALASQSELTDTQKSEIAKVEADYAAKKITEEEKNSKIADIKASAPQPKEEVKTTKESDSTEKTKTAEEKARVDKQKELQELLKSKEAGKATDSDIIDFTEKLKSVLQTGDSALVDKTV
jgi:hypothetical protein